MHFENYGIYSDLVKNGTLTIYTKDLTDENIDQHFKWIINIFCDGIEKSEIQKLKLTVVFTDNISCNLFIVDYMYNLMFWSLATVANRPISSFFLFDCVNNAITKKYIKKYIDDKFVRPNITRIEFIKINQAIDRTIGKFRDLENFQMYLSNTVNLEDTIELMNKYPEFNETIHFDTTGIPMEDVKDEGMKATKKQIEIIKNSDHCLKDSFIAGEGINAKQYKEVAVNIGSKPNGLGGVFPHPIKGSFINGGLRDVEEIVVESSIGRIAQILQKQNVGQSGAFARSLGLNNQDSRIHPDPNYICDSKNFEEVFIENQDILDEYDMRYYRFNPKGMEYRINSCRDRNLIGQTILVRSPITCASAARGEGICYRCYGDLAYVNRDINIGQIASESLSSIYTQILLSAKHLLESAIVKMNWTPGFDNLFMVEYNQIKLKEDFNYRGYKIILDEIYEYDNEEDDSDMNYVTSFDVVYPNGEVVTMETSTGENQMDEIYIHEELMEYLDKIGMNDDGVYEIDLVKAKELSALFEIDIKNDELSKTMKAIKNIIDNKKSTRSYNRNSILAAFVRTNLSGGIKINSVHFEVLIMNQIRSADDILELPDWTLENEPCQILTLNEALTNNRSISVRLQASKIQRTLSHPSVRRLHIPSNMDLFYMEKPQQFMTDEYQRSTYQPISDQKPNIVKPFTFSSDSSYNNTISSTNKK